MRLIRWFKKLFLHSYAKGFMLGGLVAFCNYVVLLMIAPFTQGMNPYLYPLVNGGVVTTVSMFVASLFKTPQK